MSTISAISWRKQATFNEMVMMMSTLYESNTLSWIFIVLAHWNNSPLAIMSLHSDTLFWFWANQSLLLSGEEQISILWSLVTIGNRSIRRKPPIWPTASHWQTWSYNVVSSTTPCLSGIRTHNVCICSYKSNYHTITTTRTPALYMRPWLL
jgi:hypothetical protein